MQALNLKWPESLSGICPRRAIVNGYRLCYSYPARRYVDGEVLSNEAALQRVLPEAVGVIELPPTKPPVVKR